MKVAFPDWNSSIDISCCLFLELKNIEDVPEEDIKHSNTLKSFNRKFKSFSTFGTEDSEVKQSDNDSVEGSDRKFETFDTKDLELEQLDNEVAQSFNRKFGTSEEESLTDLVTRKFRYFQYERFPYFYYRA